MATGHLPRVVMREPYAHTLWTYMQLMEHDRIEGRKAQGTAIANAGLTAFAFHEPKKLADEHHRWLGEIGALPTHDEARERAAAVIEAMEQIDAGVLPTIVLDPTDGRAGSPA